MKKIVVLWMIAMIYLPIIGNCSYDEIKKVKIDVNFEPVYNSKQWYTYETINCGEITYILHYLESMKKTDDGEFVHGADVPMTHVFAMDEKDEIQDCYFFILDRLEYEGKQYGIDWEEYSVFLDFSYNALKEGKFAIDEDVGFASSSWANLYVENAIEEHLVPKWNQINYQGKISRLEVCNLVANFLKLKGIAGNYEGNKFPDAVSSDVIMLNNLGIVSGKEDGEFHPYDYITREEYALILSKTCEVLKTQKNTDIEAIDYSDSDEISFWAKESVDFLTKSGLFSGNESNEFMPKKYITKEQVIVTLVKLL